jgi:uncharacterized protein YegL
MVAASEPAIHEDLLNNPSQRTACVLVLDASGSMEAKTASGLTRIQQLNQGLQTFEAELKSDSVAKVRVQVSIVCVGGPAGRKADVMQEWTDAAHFQAFDLVASGETPLGEGMLLALRIVEEQKRAYNAAGVSYTRPWVFVFTDGQPTDEAEWRRAVVACKAAEADGKCIVFAVGVHGVDVAILQQISTRKVLLLDEVKFKELFTWLSASLRAVSRATPGETIQMPATDEWAAVRA